MQVRRQYHPNPTAQIRALKFLLGSPKDSSTAKAHIVESGETGSDESFPSMNVENDLQSTGTSKTKTFYQD